MENEVEMRVWDTVKGKPCICHDTACMAALYMEERQWSERFSRLGRTAGDKRIAALSEKAKSRADAMRGMYILITGRSPAEPACGNKPSPVLPTLRRAYVDALRRKKIYQKYAADEEYGSVFAALAKETGECCMEILKAVGQTGGCSGA